MLPCHGVITVDSIGGDRVGRAVHGGLVEAERVAAALARFDIHDAEVRHRL